MCQTCYIEAGSPSIVNEATKKGAELIQALYDTEDGGVGGYAHIVTDDWNLEDDLIEFCLKEAKEKSYKWVCEETRVASIACLEHLKLLTEDERYSAMALKRGWIAN